MSIWGLGDPQNASCAWIPVPPPLTGTSYGEAQELRCDFDQVPTNDHIGRVPVFGLFTGEGLIPISVPEPSFFSGLLVGIGMLTARGGRERRG